MASSVPQSEQPLRYDHGRDLLWLLLRPWRLISRLLVMLLHFTGLAVRLVTRGSSTDHAVQSRLAQTVLKTLTQLGPCFIKVGQALSTRPDLIPSAWLDHLIKLQDQQPPFPRNAER
ncbi:MAG: AarF/ABC1/UbiB kinase family protein, partial [Synechococcus sp. SB0672_bin_10]|nr:AarF/ABC1/UbiB kinase family protein [Synechococcus sp. SB0672_bin_10]